MNRRGLEEAVRTALGGTATHSAAELAVDAVLRGIADGLQKDGVVRLARFGTFRCKQRRPRRLNLPRSRESHTLPERTVLTFKASPEKGEA